MGGIVERNGLNLKRLIFTLFALILAVPVSNAVIIPDKNIIEVSYTIGGTQPQPEVITFYNTENKTVNLSLSVVGDISDWVSLSNTTLQFVNESSQQLVVSFNISADSVGVYNGYISLSPANEVIYPTIPVYITVSSGQPQEECKLIPELTADYPTIQADTPPFEKKYIVRVGKGCVGGVEITSVYFSGTGIIQTPEGQKPIRLSGAQSLGYKYPGEQAYFNVLYDVSGLPTGTYQATAKVVGNYNGELVSAEIDFSITIVGAASPVNTSFSSLPECTLPSSMEVNTTYKFICNNVNPNIKISIPYSEYFVGVMVEEPGNQFIYTFKPVKPGETEFTAVFTYKNVPIGEPFRQKVTISEPGVPALGRGNLTFVFYPSLDMLVPGDELVVECRDSKTNKIIKDCDLYVDGRLVENKTFVVEGGRTYHLSLDAPGYLTVDKEITVELPSLKIFVTPDNPVVGDMITITVKNSVNNQDVENAEIYWDGVPVEPTFRVQSEGNHTVRVVAEGYKEAEKTVFVEMYPAATFIPKRIYLNRNVTLTLNKNASWYVGYKRSPEQPEQKIAEGKSDRVVFTPTEHGIYTVYLEGSRVARWEIKGFNPFEGLGRISVPPWLLYLVVGAVVVVIAVKLIGGRKSSRGFKFGGGGMPPTFIPGE